MKHRTLFPALLVLVLACGDDDAAITAATTSSTTSTTIATTTLVTVPVTTTMPAPITSTTAPLTFEMQPFGLWTSSAELSGVWLAALPSEIVSLGAFEYPGPSYTVALDGFLCGIGSTIGPLAGIAVGEFKEAPAYGPGERLVELVTRDPRVLSSLGVGVGWSETDMLTALGPASSEPHDPFLEVPTHRWYVYLDASYPGFGLRFRVDVATGLVDEVASGLADHLDGVLMCNS